MNIKENICNMASGNGQGLERLQEFSIETKGDCGF